MLRIGDPEGRLEEVRSAVPLRPWVPVSAFRGLNQGVNPPTWCFVAATFDATTGRVVLYQEPDVTWPLQENRAPTEASLATRAVGQGNTPLLVGGYWTGGALDTVGGHFNGRIESPRVFDRVLSGSEIEALKDGAPPVGPVAAWDFSAGISSRDVSDTSSNRLHGRAMEMPTRGVTGHDWNGRESHFDRVPEQYAAESPIQRRALHLVRQLEASPLRERRVIPTTGGMRSQTPESGMTTALTKVSISRPRVTKTGKGSSARSRRSIRTPSISTRKPDVRNQKAASRSGCPLTVLKSPSWTIVASVPRAIRNPTSE